MLYTMRQLHCLKAMGLVPWVERHGLTSVSASEHPVERVRDGSELADVQATNLSDGGAPAQQKSAARVDDIESRGASLVYPDDVNALATWLPQQALAEFDHRGTVKTGLGNADAPILVIMDQPALQAEEQPLAQSDANLLDNMLQAISLSRRDIYLCSLVASAEANCTVLSELEHADCRAVLLFVSALGAQEDAAAHRFAFGTAGFPAWRLPHPMLLQREPLRKRQAWNVLKALRTELAAN